MRCCLRHTFGTLMAAVLTPFDLKEAMGHADLATTMIYVHAQPKPAQTDAMSRLIANALKPEGGRG